MIRYSKLQHFLNTPNRKKLLRSLYEYNSAIELESQILELRTLCQNEASKRCYHDSAEFLRLENELSAVYIAELLCILHENNNLIVAEEYLPLFKSDHHD